MSDLFKICPSYPNYEVNKSGSVRRISSGKIMTQRLHGISKYFAIRTCHNNVPKNTYVHKMVADAWVPNDDLTNKTQVNHIDGDKHNNFYSNLEWCTPSQNQQHAVQNDLKGSGEDLYNASMTAETAHLVCRLLCQGYRPKDIAETYDLSKDVVRKIKDGSTWFEIRQQYNIHHTFKTEFSETTVRWVCDKIILGFADIAISKMSSNKNLTVIDVKRIRNKIRYIEISNEYF